MTTNPAHQITRCRLLAFFVFLLTLLLASAVGQSASPPAEPSKPVTSIGATVQDQPASPQQQPRPALEPQKPITKAQAKALFRSVDEILQFVSQDTGLPIKHKVKRKLITREQVRALCCQGPCRTTKTHSGSNGLNWYWKSSAWSRAEYDLHGEFLKLLGEQVAAYYDPKTKTVNLLDWVQPELQRPVLAHELTHALQDQTIDLTKWLRAGGNDHGPLPDQQEQVVEEAQAARQNLTEGQAMLAMLDYTLAPAGLNVLKSPPMLSMPCALP